MTLARPWIRTVGYTLLAMAAAAMVMFTGLGADRVWGDEAVYASCVDTIAVPVFDKLSRWPGQSWRC